MVEAIAKRLARRLGWRVSIDDLRGLGNLAVLDVVRAYDPSRSAFAPYASRKLRYTILDSLRRETRARLSPRALGVLASETYALVGADDLSEEERGAFEELSDGAQLDTLLGGHAAALAMGLASHPAQGQADEQATPEEAVARAELGGVLRAVVQELPERERDLLERYYFGGKNLDVIATELGISKSWASRIHERALRAMSERIKDAL